MFQKIASFSLPTLILIAIVFGSTIATAAGAQPSVEIGKITTDGTISFYTWKFRTEIANGLPVHNIYSEIANGLAHVVLAGPEGCKGVMLPLWTDHGPLADPHEDPTGWVPDLPVYVVEDPTFTPFTFACKDKGCSAFADGPGREWKCRRPSSSPCECWVTLGGDVVFIYGPDYCKSPFTALPAPWDLEDFIRWQFI